jgi:hypothetical protein
MSALTVTLGADITALKRAMAGATELVRHNGWFVSYPPIFTRSFPGNTRECQDCPTLSEEPGNR